MEKERNRGETQDKRNFQGMFPLPCACGVLRPHPLLSHQGSSTIGGIPVLAFTKFYFGIPHFLPFQTRLWSQV